MTKLDVSAALVLRGSSAAHAEGQVDGAREEAAEEEEAPSVRIGVGSAEGDASFFAQMFAVQAAHDFKVALKGPPKPLVPEPLKAKAATAPPPDAAVPDALAGPRRGARAVVELALAAPRLSLRFPGGVTVAVAAQRVTSKDAALGVSLEGLEAQLQGKTAAALGSVEVEFMHRLPTDADLDAAGGSSNAACAPAPPSAAVEAPCAPSTSSRLSNDDSSESAAAQHHPQHPDDGSSGRSNCCGAAERLLGTGPAAPGIGPSSSRVLVLTVRVKAPLLRLPDELQLGACIRDIEVGLRGAAEWRWRASEAAAASLGRSREDQQERSSEKKKSRKPRGAPRMLELSVVLERGSLEAEAPLWEAWLGSHAPLLAAAAAHGSIQDEVCLPMGSEAGGEKRGPA